MEVIHAPFESQPIGEFQDLPPLQRSPCTQFPCERCLLARGGFKFPWVGAWTPRGTIVPHGLAPGEARRHHARPKNAWTQCADCCRGCLPSRPMHSSPALSSSPSGERRCVGGGILRHLAFLVRVFWKSTSARKMDLTATLSSAPTKPTVGVAGGQAVPDPSALWQDGWQPKRAKWSWPLPAMTVAHLPTLQSLRSGTLRGMLRTQASMSKVWAV